MSDGAWHFVQEREVDGRRRLSLARAGKPEHKRYQVWVQPNGDILLQPVVSVLARDVPETAADSQPSVKSGRES